MSYLTGFDPRFEEAILVVGETGEPAILVGNENWGTAGAAPLPMRRHRFQDLSLPGQPRDRSRPLAELLGEEGIGPGTRVGVIGWKTYASPDVDRGAGVPRGRAATAGRSLGIGAQRHGPPDRPGRRPAGRQRGRAARLVRIRGVPDVAGRAQPAVRAASRADRGGGGSAARVERHAAVVPPDVDGRTARHVRPAQPGHAQDRARRPVHGGIRRVGRAELPGGVRRRGCRRAADGHRRLRREARGTVFRGDRRVVWRDPHRADGRGAAGDHRPPARRPVLRDLPEPRAPDPSRRVDQLADLARIAGGAALGHGLPGRRHPGDRDGLLHDQHRGRDRPRRRVAP